MNDEVKELADIIEKSPCWNRAQTNIKRYISQYLRELSQAIIAAGYRKSMSDEERRERIAKTIWEDECERNTPSSPDEWDTLPRWAQIVYLELADKILALFPKPALLTDEEINKAFDSAFDKDVYFDPKPTTEEILTIRLRSVAQTLIAAGYRKYEPLNDMGRREKIVKEITPNLHKVELAGCDALRSIRGWYLSMFVYPDSELGQALKGEK
jgi:hypothetical protein